MPEGSCVCGKTTYSYDEAAMKVVCHCLTCRKLTGSTYSIVASVPEGRLKIQGDGVPRKTYGTHENGMNFEFFGCDSCPSTLYKTADGFPGSAFVLLGTLDGKEDVTSEGKPAMEFWTKYRVPWLKPIEGCAQFEEFPPEQEA